MFKKIILIIMCLIIMVSCGRKADPEYKKTEREIIIQKI